MASIKFEGVKMVRVATQRKSTIDLRACEEAVQRDSGGSMFCPDTQLQSPTVAYHVTYSYLGRPMASDESGSRNFNFSVYLRPDELSPDVRQKLTGHNPLTSSLSDVAVAPHAAGCPPAANSLIWPAPRFEMPATFANEQLSVAARPGKFGSVRLRSFR